MRVRQRGFIKWLMLLLIGVLGVWGFAVYKSAQTFQEFLAENKELKAALTKLTEENQIGYAKVVSREEVDGETRTTVAFYQTDRDNPERRVFEGEFELQGDVIHFDALVVRFQDQMVLDDERRSIYLWRRIYDENTPPSQGDPIEDIDEAPARYRSLLPEPDMLDQVLLKEDFRQQFWQSIWDLANDTEALKQHGISAVYGNAVYTRMEPGKLYQFKINAAGQIYPEVVADL
ncbi:MAG: hypothetical protein R3202_03650 [Candidatus Competibacterales bacterium]|nr:hypothetical protein [Candidatus Competibacterales bacterium]